MVSLVKNVVLQVPSETESELRQMKFDQAICSKCWMQLRKMILEIPSSFPWKKEVFQKEMVVKEDQSDCECIYSNKVFEQQLEVNVLTAASL